VSTTDAPDQAEVESEAPPPAEERHGCLVLRSLGQEVLLVPRDRYLDVIGALKDEGYAMCIDVTAVDYLVHGSRPLPPGIAAERFEVVVNLLSLESPRRVRLRVQVPATDPSLPSLFDLYPGSEAMEREVFDLMGIRFIDHPDLTRILMPEDWEGHPLRKDYSMGRVPVQFKHPPATR
jgi:NADH-quinone oxidoreductase subunit C